MRLLPTLAAAVLLVSGTGALAAPKSTRIAETGALLLGNAHRCGVPDDRVVRAGKVVRELIVAASDGPGQQLAAKSRFAEIFRETARPEGDGRAATPPCKAVRAQLERIERFRDSPVLLTAPRRP